MSERKEEMDTCHRCAGMTKVRWPLPTTCGEAQKRTRGLKKAMFTEEGPEHPCPSWEPVESASLFAISCTMPEDVPPERLYKNVENIPHPEAWYCIL